LYLERFNLRAADMVLFAGARGGGNTSEHKESLAKTWSVYVRDTFTVHL